MLLDWLVYGLLIFGMARISNATAFTAKPASPSAAWGLTIAVFFLNLVALSFIKVLRYKAISDNLPGFNPTISLKDILPGAFVFAFLFFFFLRREQKKQSTASLQEKDVKKPEPQPLPQDIPQNAKSHPEESAGPSIPNVSHKIKKPVWGSKFSILLMIFLVAGVGGGIGLFYLFSDREENARNKLIEMNISFNRDTFIEKTIAGDVVAVRLFLEAGVSPNSKTEGGWSALMVASNSGQQSVAEVLLKNGADINMQGHDANTALDLAKGKGHINLAKFLRLKGGLTGGEESSKRIEEILKNTPPEQKAVTPRPPTPESMDFWKPPEQKN